jgi:hypothetical protein
MKKTIADVKIDASTVDKPATGPTSALTNPVAASIIITSPVLAKIANQITHELALPRSMTTYPSPPRQTFSL